MAKTNIKDIVGILGGGIGILGAIIGAILWLQSPTVKANNVSTQLNEFIKDYEADKELIMLNQTKLDNKLEKYKSEMTELDKRLQLAEKEIAVAKVERINFTNNYENFNKQLSIIIGLVD